MLHARFFSLPRFVPVRASFDLALVIVYPIPGQEERNADHLLEAGAAIRCNNLPALAWRIDRLLDDPGRLVAMRANARRLARQPSSLGMPLLG